MKKTGRLDKTNILKLSLIMVIGIIVFAIGYYVNIPEQLSIVMEWLNQLGWLGIVFYFFLYLIGSILVVPSWILSVSGGFVFGLFRGAIIVPFAATLGAAGAFIVGRYIGRDWIRKLVSRHPKFKAIDEAVKEEGWLIVGLIRLSPIFPYNIQNYVFGLTGIKFKHFVIASWIGMIPLTLLYVYFGSIAGSIAALGTDAFYESRTNLQWYLYGFGFIITVVVTVYITRVARRALKKRIDQ